MCRACAADRSRSRLFPRRGHAEGHVDIHASRTVRGTAVLTAALAVALASGALTPGVAHADAPGGIYLYDSDLGKRRGNDADVCHFFFRADGFAPGQVVTWQVERLPQGTEALRGDLTMDASGSAETGAVDLAKGDYKLFWRDGAAKRFTVTCAQTARPASPPRPSPSPSAPASAAAAVSDSAAPRPSPSASPSRNPSVVQQIPHHAAPLPAASSSTSAEGARAGGGLLGPGTLLVLGAGLVLVAGALLVHAMAARSERRPERHNA